ncbi:hypothetical protein Poly30_34970 [Planctomycetes bacterium Poly30]|uniref:Uncharacterized protein n=1 Tax=Saltatorellus ferox TaxID=2528018 RepID=A0A518EV66_9BACT|nr:hypothetical protein Poly30_34970 [Planctomycetes bacterium Poly30]
MPDSQAPPDLPKPAGRAGPAGRRGRLSLALLLLVVALGFRLVGIDHGLPHFGEPDTYLVNQADSMIEGGITNRERAGWKYPHLVGTILALVPPEPIERLAPGATLQEHQELATRLRKRGRVVVAVMSSLAAPATYLIAARFLGARFAFLAGLLVASSLLHICFSVQARPHGPVSAMATIALLCAIRWREKPSFGRAAVLGLGVAGSLCTLHSGAAALAPAGAALLGLLRTGAPRAKVLLGTLLALTIIAVSAGWFYIRAENGYGLNPNRTAGAIAKRGGGLGDAELDKIAQTGRSLTEVYKDKKVIVFSGHVVPLSFFNGYGFVVAAETLATYDPIILFFVAIGVLGILAMALRRRAARGERSTEKNCVKNAASAAWITAAYGVPTLLVYGIYQASTDRFYLALVPVTCILAAYGMSWLWARRIPRVLTGFVLATSVFGMVLGAAAAARLRVLPDTYELAAEAIEQLSGDQDRLVYMAEVIGIPLMTKRELFQKDAMWSRGPWDTYQWHIAYENPYMLIGETSRSSREHAAPYGEAADRLGKRIMPAHAATRLKLYHSEDRAATAAEALSEVDPDIVLVGTSMAPGKGPLGPTAIRDAWKEAVRADGRWKLNRTIHNSRRADDYPLGYKLGFVDVLTNYARGPEIEVWTRIDS